MIEPWATPNDWQILDDGRKIQTFEVEHYGMKQRWHVLSSETSKQRAIKQVDKKVSKEGRAIEKQLFHLQAKRFNCAEDAKAAAEAFAKKWQFYHLKGTKTVEHSYELTIAYFLGVIIKIQVPGCK
ncbi:MAG: hypothetical protein QM500_16605 [Methylococcales bacterium]